MKDDYMSYRLSILKVLAKFALTTGFLIVWMQVQAQLAANGETIYVAGSGTTSYQSATKEGICAQVFGVLNKPDPNLPGPWRSTDNGSMPEPSDVRLDSQEFTNNGYMVYGGADFCGVTRIDHFIYRGGGGYDNKYQLGMTAASGSCVGHWTSKGQTGWFPNCLNARNIVPNTRPRLCPACGDPIFPMSGTNRQIVNTGIVIGGIELKLTYDSSRAPWPALSAIQDLDYTKYGDLSKLWYLSPLTKLVDTNTGFLEFVGGDGAISTFSNGGAGLYHAADGFVSFYVDNSSNRYFVDQDARLEWKYGGDIVNSNDRNSRALLNLTTSNGVNLTATNDADGDVKQLSDSFGRQITINYNTNAVTGRKIVSSIVDSANNTTAFDYDLQGNLAGITWPDSNRRSFQYNQADPNLSWALTKVIDEQSIANATFSYDPSGFTAGTASGSNKGHSLTFSSPPSWTVDETADEDKFLLWRVHRQAVPQGGQVLLPNGHHLGMRFTAVPSTSNDGFPTQLLRLAGVDRLDSDGSSKNIGYDQKGNANQIDDFNGNRSCFAFDQQSNRETVRVEGLLGGANGVACSSVLNAGAQLPAGSRKITTAWHPFWTAVKVAEAYPFRQIQYIYNGRPDPFNGGAVASCAGGATLPDGRPIVVICKQVEQATLDSTGAQGFSASLDPAVKPRTLSWTYNQYGQILTAKGARTDLAPPGDITTYAYYSATTINVATGVNVGVTIGDLKTVTDALGHITQFTQYNPYGQLMREVDPNNVVTTYTYDLRRHLKTRTVNAETPQARTTSYDYWPTGLLKSITFPSTVVGSAAGTGGNASPRSFSYAYDDAHRLTSVTSATGEQLVYTLDDSGNVTREEVRNSLAVTGVASVTKREFDVVGRLWKQIRAVNGIDQTTQFGYDPEGNLTSTQLPVVPSYGESSGPLEVRRYNALNQLARIEDAVNGSTKPTLLSPDKRDLVTQAQSPNGATTGYTLDGLGQTTLEISPDAGNTTNSFDDAGNLKTRTDARGVTLAWIYDALNRPTTMTVRKTGSTDTSEDQTWVWDASPVGSPLVCSNGLGRLCKQTDLSGSTYYAYDPFGNIVQRTLIEVGATTTQNFAYDGEDRLATLSGVSGKAIALSRDAEGRVGQANAVVGGASLVVLRSSSFRADGQISATQLGNNVSLTRQFDSSGAVTAEADSGTNTVPVGPGSDTPEDAPTAPEWAMILLGGWLAWQVAWPRMRSTASPGTNAHVHSPAWVALLIFLCTLIAPTPSRADETLKLDERGNVQSRTVDGRTSTYQYDQLDRLTKETGKANQSFGLDPNGNRLSDGQAAYTVQANGNRLLTRNGQSWLYDPAGNLLQDQTQINGQTVTRSFSYWMSGMLKTVSINGQLVATYYHNAQNQRTRKVLVNPPAGTPAITLYRYDPQGMLSEEIAASGARSGQTLVTYIWRDDIPAALIYAPNTPSNPTAQEKIVYLHADHLGSPRKASDASARIVWTWESDAFGSSAPNEDPDGDGVKTTINLRLPGQYFDAESGLYYNGNRYYDPQTGRYVQSDPIGLNGGINTYSYVGGNPQGFTDPTGTFVPFVVPAAVEVLAEVAAAAAAREAARQAALATLRAGVVAAAAAATQSGSTPQPASSPKPGPSPLSDRDIWWPEKQSGFWVCKARADCNDNIPGNCPDDANKRFAFGGGIARSQGDARNMAKANATSNLQCQPKHVSCKCTGPKGEPYSGGC